MVEFALQKHAEYILSVEKGDLVVILGMILMYCTHKVLSNVWLFLKKIIFGIEKVTKVFCCIGALAITGHLERVDKELLGWWLCERQVKSGGLNGWPEKLPDVCYSWWVLSSLTIIGRVNWIDKEKLIEFILNCQDTEKGGISDRPDDAIDIYHTYFWSGRALASLIPRDQSY